MTLLKKMRSLLLPQWVWMLIIKLIILMPILQLGAIAKKLKSRRLLLMTDVEGVLDKNKKLISEITPDIAKKMMDEDIITGGMIPKINTCIDAIIME